MFDPAVRQALLGEVEEELAREEVTEARLLTVLDRILKSFGCAVGTIHSLDPETGMLRLRAQRGVPDGLLPRVQIIPLGKGMAGLAAEQRQPVQICNLQHHDGSLAQPAARQTGMEGSIAVPMLTAGRLHGVLGVAKPIPYTYSEPETALLLEVAAVMGKYLGG